MKREANFDVYKGSVESNLRMATAIGAGLPPHVKSEDWILMERGLSQVIEDAEEDIEARGFCFYKLVPVVT